ncbi:MAG TPA: FeoB small GTPase domain-containing protein [Pyrinomonadaceae bacterium]|jgi:ferrous iron transport protein B
MKAFTAETGKCGDCASGCAPKRLTKLGARVRKFDAVAALAGNPNTGKSTIFNALTGLRQHVGNWAGKTVARAEGAFETGGKKFKLIDLPGTYSLLSTSPDEEIARDFLLFGKPDVTVVVGDAMRLERSLHLVLQILEITTRVVFALNLMDEARRARIRIDARQLARDLNVPVVAMAARRGEGVSELLEAVSETARRDFSASARRISYADKELENAVETLAANLRANFGELPNARWIALRLLEGDENIIRAVRANSLGAEKSGSHLTQLALAEAR